MVGIQCGYVYIFNDSEDRWKRLFFEQVRLDEGESVFRSVTCYATAPCQPKYRHIYLRQIERNPVTLQISSHNIQVNSGSRQPI